jgi:putative membrane protein
MKATTFLTRREQADVELAIADAEGHTSAELVCALATESGRYDRAESIVGLVAALIALAVAHVAGVGLSLQPGSWEEGTGVALGWQVLAVVLGFVAGAVASSLWQPLRRLATAEGEMLEEVERAASHVFATQRLGSTRSETGVLIYVSLFERRVVVMADRRAREALGQEGIDALMELARSRLREGRRAATFLDTITEAATRLAPSLPPGEESPDELPNRLRLFHPRPE